MARSAARLNKTRVLGFAWLLQVCVALDFEFTHLGFNAQRWRFPRAASDAAGALVDTATVLVDPVAGRLEFFGSPAVYCADAGLDARRAEALMVEHAPCAILITQNFDDHCHVPTLEMLSEKLASTFVVIAPPSARRTLERIFDAKTLLFVEPGESVVVPRGAAQRGACAVRRERPSAGEPLGSGLVVTAVRGSRVGPPWSKRELGFLAGNEADAERVYYEPHGDVFPSRSLCATAVVAPVTEQRLGPLVLVHGKRRALETATALGASTLIPLNNGDGSASGVLAELIETSNRGGGRPPKDDGQLVIAAPQIGIPFRLRTDPR